MLKLRHIPALIAVAVFVSAAGPSSAPDTIPPLNLLEQRVDTLEKAEDTEVRDNERQDLQAQQSMGDSARRMLWPAWLQAVTGALGVAGVVGSLIFSTLTHRQNKLSSERQLRAYMGITTIKFDSVEAGVKPRVRINTKNFGQTPAYNIREELFIKLVRNGDDVVIELKPVGGGLCVNPGADFWTMLAADEALTQEDVDLVTAVPKTGESAPYVIMVAGKTTYTDAFKVDRHIYFDSGHWGPGLDHHVLAVGLNYVT